MTINKNDMDFTGQRFGAWTLIERLDYWQGGSSRTYTCRCDCGNIRRVNIHNLVDGKSTKCQSCAAKISNTKHGLSRTSAYKQAQTNKRIELSKIFDSQWTIEMEQLLCDLQPRCVICNASAKETDHVLPLSKGYGLKPGNAIRLCKSCNSKKSNKLLPDLPEVWRNRIIMAAESFRCEWEFRSAPEVF